MKRLRIAVVGAGIAGLCAAYRLARRHDVTVLEANTYAGGHTHTIDVVRAGRHWAVDTGFIVFNDWTYPRFIGLLEELRVASQPSSMSFSVACPRTGLEYNGTSVNTLFAQRRNIASMRFLRMIADILRFNRRSRDLLRGDDDEVTLGEWLERAGYSRAFCDYYLLPMGRAVWSAGADAILGFPARFFVEFFDRHGFLNIDDRPRWRVVAGGSRQYVRRIEATLAGAIELASPVRRIRRTGTCVELTGVDGHPRRFDAAFLACHADQALALLADPTPVEREVLAAFPYAPNVAVLHTDERLLPRAPRARAAWNYRVPFEPQERVVVTYDMNVLQSLAAPCRFLVTLNHEHAIDPAHVIGRYEYSHPVYTPRGVAAQRRHREVNGTGAIYYCGAYWRYGFHEDGVVSALTALEHFESDHARTDVWTDAELRLHRVG